MAEAARLAWRAAREAADQPGRLEVVRTAAPKGSGGGERSGPGVLLTGVMPGSPAEQAGLKGGDVVTGLGGKKVLNLQDLSSALGAHRPGDQVELVYQRDGRELAVKVTLAERK